MSIEELLRNYLGDLSYQHDCGLDHINFCSNGTPFFDTDAEAKQYIKDLSKAIEDL